MGRIKLMDGFRVLHLCLPVIESVMETGNDSTRVGLIFLIFQNGPPFEGDTGTLDKNLFLRCGSVFGTKRSCLFLDLKTTFNTMHYGQNTWNELVINTVRTLISPLKTCHTSIHILWHISSRKEYQCFEFWLWQLM